MSESYLKEGRTTRLELVERDLYRIDLVERGESSEREGAFSSRTLSGTPAGLREPEMLPETVTDVLLGLDDACERATVTSGRSRHHITDSNGERGWIDSAVRLHVSIVNREMGFRCDVERGAETFDPNWLSELEEIAVSAGRARDHVEPRDRLLLDPAVSAAVLATLAARGIFDIDGGLIQRPRLGERDGKGFELVEARLSSPDGLGWFRPSYRSRPRKAPHGIDVALEPALHTDSPPDLRALALIAPPRVDGRLLRLPCLIASAADQDVGIATAQIDLDSWNPRTADGHRIWFPFGAGVWGRRLAVATTQ